MHVRCGLRIGRPIQVREQSFPSDRRIGPSVYLAIQHHEDLVVMICTWLVWIELQLANLCHC